jgi:phospholipid transport system substrate-binding protein
MTMKQFIRYHLVFIGIVLLCSLGAITYAYKVRANEIPTASSTANAAVTAPDQLIRQMTEEVLQQIRTDKALQNGDPKKLQSLVDSKIMPNINFQKMTALAVGRGWRGASPEQQKSLQTEFRTLLMKTYSGALQSVQDQKITVKPLRGKPDDTDTTVRTQITRSGNDPIQLDYRLEKTSEGWKIYDVNVLGVWLIENYKNVFSEQQNNGGIDGLLQFLRERNQGKATK